MEKAIPYILIGIAVLIAVFLIFREILCWYWKINEQISLQTETNRLLSNLLDQLTRNDALVNGKTNTNVITKTVCSSCGKENQDSNAVFCESCGAKLQSNQNAQ